LSLSNRPSEKLPICVEFGVQSNNQLVAVVCVTDDPGGSPVGVSVNVCPASPSRPDITKFSRWPMLVENELPPSSRARSSTGFTAIDTTAGALSTEPLPTAKLNESDPLKSRSGR